MFKWDGTVNIVTVFQTVVIVIGLYQIFARLDRLETKVEPLWQWFTQMLTKD